MRSKRGQLAFISILVTLIIFFFILRAHMYGVDWLEYMGQEQAEVQNSFYVPEQVKVYAGSALRGISYNLLKGDCSSRVLDAGKLATFRGDLDVAFADALDNYDAEGLDIEVPTYKLSVSSDTSKTGVIIDAYPLSEGCEDSTPEPEELCENIGGIGDSARIRCAAVKDDGGNMGACRWQTVEVSGKCQDSSYLLGDENLEICPAVWTLAEWDAQKVNFPADHPCVSDRASYSCCASFPVNCAWYGCADSTPAPAQECDLISDASVCGDVEGCSWMSFYPEKITASSELSFDYMYSVSADGYVKQTITCDEVARAYQPAGSEPEAEVTDGTAAGN